MRISLLLAFLALICAAAPAAAQPAASLPPLPAELVPGGLAVDQTAMVADNIDLGMITGALVGMTVGAGFALTVADRCGIDSDCTLTPVYKTLIYGIVGTTLGVMIGVGTTFVLGWRAARPEDAALAVTPLDAGGMQVGVTLRH